MRHVNRTLATATAFLAASVLAAGTVAAEEIVIKFSHVVSAEGHPKGEAAAAFAERVNNSEELAGKVRVEVYPNSQLYNDDKVFQAMLLGDVQMAAPSLSKFEPYTLKYRIFDLPFLFQDIEAVDRFQASESGQALLTEIEENGLLGLAYWHNGMKQLSANRPLLVPEDAEGLKFRVQQSDVLVAQFRALDAVPQKMAFSEVYGALQQGVVDGQENSWSNIYTQKFYEVQDGITESNHGLLDYMVVTSKRFWDGLPDDVRSELERILAEVSTEKNKDAYQTNLDARATIAEEDGPIRELSDEQRQKWVEAMRPVWEQFEDDIGAELIEKARSFNES